MIGTAMVQGRAPVSRRVQRYRGGLFIAAASVGTLVAVGSLAVYIVKQWLYRQQLRIAEEHFVKEQIKRRFDQTQSDSLATLYELVQVSSMVYDQKDLNLDEIMLALRDKKLQKQSQTGSAARAADTTSNSSVTGVTSALNDKVSEKASSIRSSKTDDIRNMTKGELWNELKIRSISKLVTVTYTTSCLLLMTRLQLNILTRKEYLETVVKTTMQKNNDAGNSSGFFSWVASKIWGSPSNGEEKRKSAQDMYGELVQAEKAGKHMSKGKVEYINEQAFLSIFWWLINRGWSKIHEIVEREVRSEFGHLDPKDALTIDDFSERLTKVYYRVNKTLFLVNEEKEKPLLDIMIPRTPQELKNVLEQAMDLEALQLLEQDDSILRQLCKEMEKYMKSEATSIVMEQAINESFDYAITEIDASIKKRNQAETQMALFALSCKECCDKMLKTNMMTMDNDYLTVLDGIAVLDDLSAMVYSNFGL